jgi:hypothetical protein
VRVRVRVRVWVRVGVWIMVRVRVSAYCRGGPWSSSSSVPICGSRLYLSLSQ